MQQLIRHSYPETSLMLTSILILLLSFDTSDEVANIYLYLLFVLCIPDHRLSLKTSL